MDGLVVKVLFYCVPRTLEYLMKHLSRVATRSNETGMTPKNMAIVWAPNLIRCKELESGGVAALKVNQLKSRFIEKEMCPKIC